MIKGKIVIHVTHEDGELSVAMESIGLPSDIIKEVMSKLNEKTDSLEDHSKEDRVKATERAREKTMDFLDTMTSGMCEDHAKVFKEIAEKHLDEHINEMNNN